MSVAKTASTTDVKVPINSDTAQQPKKSEINQRTDKVAQAAIQQSQKEKDAPRASCCARVWKVFSWIFYPFTWLISKISSCCHEIFSTDPVEPPTNTPDPNETSNSVPTPTPPAKTQGNPTKVPQQNPEKEKEPEKTRHAPTHPSSTPPSKVGSPNKTPAAVPVNLKKLKDDVVKQRSEVAKIKKISSLKDVQKLYTIQNRLEHLQAEQKKRGAEIAKKSASAIEKSTYAEIEQKMQSLENETLQKITESYDEVYKEFSEMQEGLSNRLSEESLKALPPEADDVEQYSVYLEQFRKLENLGWITAEDPTHQEIVEAGAKLKDAVGFTNRTGLPPDDNVTPLQNVCWMNATLQALFAIDEIVNRINQDLVQGKDESNNSFAKRQNLQGALRNILTARDSGDISSVTRAQEELEGIIFSLGIDGFDAQSRGNQNDSSSLVLIILEYFGFAIPIKQISIEILEEDAKRAPEQGSKNISQCTLEVAFQGKEKNLRNLIQASLEEERNAKETPWRTDKGVDRYRVVDRLMSIPPFLPIQLKRRVIIDPLKDEMALARQISIKDAVSKVKEEAAKKSQHKSDTEKEEKSKDGEKVTKSQTAKKNEAADKSKKDDKLEKLVKQATDKATKEAESKVKDQKALLIEGILQRCRKEINDVMGKPLLDEVFQEADKDYANKLTSRRQNFKLPRTITYPKDNEGVFDLTDIFDPSVRHNDEPIAYRVKSFIVHGGNGGGGHYFAYRMDDQGRWRCYNDHRVTLVNDKELEEAFGNANNVLLEHL